MAGRLLGLFSNLIIFPCLAGAVGWVFIDKLSPFINTMPNMPMDCINTLNNLRLIFAAGCFLFVLIICFNHMAQSQNQTDMSS
jgi:hypothetical protein